MLKITISFSYVVREIRKNWRNKEWWRGRIVYYPVGGFYRRLMKNKRTYIVNEDWDNLIVLDACRYDTFKEVTGINADFRISCGSCTPEFLKENFANHKLMDTVVVTANPFVDLIVKNSFYKVISVWDDGWEDNLNTVLPKTVVEYALEAEKEYSDKKLIIWFIQPHSPFLSDFEFSKEGCRHIKDSAEGKSFKGDMGPWKKARKGKVSIERIWKAYRRNLEIVIHYAFGLAKKLKGKTIITSDHGNTFRRLLFPLPINVAGHPPRIHIPELVRVPWLVVDIGERKTIQQGDEEERLKSGIKKLKKKGKI